jgi:hypothetical protein
MREDIICALLVWIYFIMLLGYTVWQEFDTITALVIIVTIVSLSFCVTKYIFIFTQQVLAENFPHDI